MARSVITALALIGLFGMSSLALDTSPDEIKVQIKGTLKFGVVAIGGETTGVTITSGKTIWELDLGENAELKKQAEGLNGARVEVAGLYMPRPGVEVKVRHIVKVTSLKGLIEK